MFLLMKWEKALANDNGTIDYSSKAQGLHTMIGVIDSENKSSITFHEQFGFKTVGIIKESGFKFDRWLDSVFMQLLLE